MHTIEPFYNWEHFYQAKEDEHSPFYGKEHSEFEFSDKIYNYFIHPQWDGFGSQTLYLKVLFVDYDQGFTVIELIGEWNDCINNDIMFLKREIIDVMIGQGIQKFILIGENVLNFHASDDAYYEEWKEDLEDGWIWLMNFRDHVIDEMTEVSINQYTLFNREADHINWRKFQPLDLLSLINVNRLERIT